MDGTSAGLNKYDVYSNDFYGGASLTETRILSFYPYSTTSGPTYHTFAMQLTSGERVYGHVRRYLPKHALVRSRVDVGRRAARALVLLTRHTGGDKFFHSLLKYVVPSILLFFYKFCLEFISLIMYIISNSCFWLHKDYGNFDQFRRNYP